MDGQEYLDQISASTRPIKTSRSGGFLTSKWFLIGGGFVVGLIIIFVLSSIINGGKTNEKNLSFSLKIHLDNTVEIINTYQKEVKSSGLRSSSSSLLGVLSDTNSKLTEYITTMYDFRLSNVGSNIVDPLTLEKDNLDAELFKAKINGILDRIYAHKMAFEITSFMNEESKIYDMTKNDDLKNILSTSYDSLSNLYESFNGFSETK